LVYFWIRGSSYHVLFFRLHATRKHQKKFPCYKKYKNSRNFVDEKAKCQPWIKTRSQNRSFSLQQELLEYTILLFTEELLQIQRSAVLLWVQTNFRF
jgi:hypothetical protein